MNHGPASSKKYYFISEHLDDTRSKEPASTIQVEASRRTPRVPGKVSKWIRHSIKTEETFKEYSENRHAGLDTVVARTSMAHLKLWHCRFGTFG